MTMSIPHPSRSLEVGRLRRLRVDELAEEGSAALLDHSEHLLQLRVGVRHPRVRRQGDARRPQDRGQPRPSRQPRPHVREGRRHAEPARGSGSHPVSAEARRHARRRRVGARDVGRGRSTTSAARIRKAIVEDRRHEVMYHVGRPGEDGYVNRVLQAWGIDGHNSHTNVCSSSARLGALSVDRRRSAVARLREREDDPAALVAPRDGPLLQPARAAHHRRQVARREAHRRSIRACRTRRRRPTCGCRRNPGTEARAAARDRAAPASTTGKYNREFVQPLGELGDVPRGRAGRSCRARSRRSRRRCKEEYAQFTPEYAGDRNRRARRTRSSKPPRRSPPPARRFPRTAGAPPRPATCGAGRSRAASTCSSC